MSCANFELSDDCCLVLSDSSSLFVYVHHQQPHLLIQTKPLARLLGEQQLVDCQPTVSFKKLLMDRLKREHKEKTRLILSRTQSQLSSSSALSTPKLLPKPSESISQPTDQTDQVLSANKERLKKYMLYELNKAGILRDNPEFHVYWKSLYANCQFQLRKEISNVNLKREVCSIASVTVSKCWCKVTHEVIFFENHFHNNNCLFISIVDRSPGEKYFSLGK